jgi:hypothetical protein
MPPAHNVWAQRSTGAVGSNGQMKTDASQSDSGSVNGFNAAELKAYLSRDVGSVAVYKPAEAAGSGKSGGAWGQSQKCESQFGGYRDAT